jgi:hypothetical protein
MEVLAELFQLAIPLQDDPDMFSVGHGRRTAYSVSPFRRTRLSERDLSTMWSLWPSSHGNAL